MGLTQQGADVDTAYGLWYKWRMTPKPPAFEHFRSLHFHDDTLGVSLDVSRIHFTERFFENVQPRLAKAFATMRELEAGAIANPDENRRVGHYWLRAPELAPEPAIRDAITSTLARLHAFADDVHQGRVHPERAAQFRNLLVIGIGGSALGPELAAAALTSSRDRLRPFFFDNTDPDGFDRTLAAIGDGLAETITIVISKSGGTKETRNGMLEAAAAYTRRGLSFAQHAVAVTGEDSELDRFARAQNFLARFPMWDWVGGRTSELSAVGLVPAALQGLDIDALLGGARAMDVATRVADAHKNPAALLALAWLSTTAGVGKKDMVVLPYKDRLELFSRYLQQLVMESLGKRLDLAGREVHQGIAVYGNKGSTDQHAYVQQLRDGLDNFFVTFIEVLRDAPDRAGPDRAAFEVEPGLTSGDFLHGFLQGTRQALTESGRESITVTLDAFDAAGLGKLIALYERAVGLYAALVGINAYHQPGVEAGKKAAQAVLDLQARVVKALSQTKWPMTCDEVAQAIGDGDREAIFHMLRHLAANPEKRIVRVRSEGKSIFEATYAI